MGEVILDRDELVRRCKGKRVVLTNGCFDLLHVGHVRALNEAAAHGELLVVDLNDDASVRGLKGPGRPLVPCEERAEILANLVCIDFVHPFSEATVDALLRALRPAGHAKGPDYNVDNLPEGGTLKELGIELLSVGDKKDRSVSDLLAKIRSQ